MFTKSLQSVSIEEACERVRHMGFDGLDLTVRPGGHVDPDEGNVASALSAAKQAAHRSGLTLPMMTTAITDAADRVAETIFQVAADHGVRLIKLGYEPYRGFGTLQATFDRVRRRLDGIEALARRTGVCAVVHNHSGDYLSAVPAIVAKLLEGRDPRYLAAYLDPGHLLVEGMRGGWRQGLELLRPHIAVMSAKSFGFVPERRQGDRQARWRPVAMPFDEGTVPWTELLRCMAGFEGPVSFHSEYDLPLAALQAQTERDLAFFRKALAEVHNAPA